MYISPTDVENIYEGINSDVRFTRMLDQTQSDSRGYVPMKIHQASLDEFNKNRLSLIRLPEIFYIAAECYATSATPNLDMALQRLNKIRENRGISTKNSFPKVSCSITISEQGVNPFLIIVKR